MLAQGHADEALASLASSLEVAQRVAASDPSNAGWQRDVAISLTDWAALNTRKVSPAEALASYEAGRAIMERLRR